MQYIIYLCAIFIVFCPKTSYMDYSHPYQVSFQDPATPVMEGIISLHHDLLFMLTIIGIFVAWVLFRTTLNFHHTRNPVPSDITHNATIEVIWTVTPSLILMVIAVPSFALIYSMDEVIDPAVTLKVQGFQWYWVYEYSDYADKEGNAISFESYMVADDDLEEGQLRLLEVDNRVVLPTNTHLRVLVTASDVLHCWPVPSLGVKIDACPGRLNQISMFIKREGVYFGQCSEICGINHGFMPIVVEAVPVEKYVSWVAAQTECENWLVDKIAAIQSLNTSSKK
jgi:cytochrome c oxidase subunit 2